MSINKHNILIRKSGKINWNNSCPRRAGIILYNDCGIYLGVDTYSKDLTDFGGEVNYVNEDAISGSLREYREETLDSFPKLTWFDIFSGDVILSDSIVIFLVRVKENLESSIDNFRDKKEKIRISELFDILYIKWEDLYKYQIYDRIEPLIDYAINNYDWK